VKGPPDPFKPAIETLPKGHRLYRVFTNTRPPTEFNPGVGAATRFGFFGKPVVPIMYAADTEEAAIAETLLHEARRRPRGCDVEPRLQLSGDGQMGRSRARVRRGRHGVDVAPLQ
jgi:hypothetical protein